MVLLFPRLDKIGIYLGFEALLRAIGHKWLSICQVIGQFKMRTSFLFLSNVRMCEKKGISHVLKFSLNLQQVTLKTE